MSLIYADGLDFYGSIGEALSAGWVYGNTSMDVLPSSGRFGGGCFSRESSLSDNFWLRNLPRTEDHPTFIIQWAFKPQSDGQLSFYSLIEFRENDNVSFSLYVTPTGIPYFRDDSNGTVKIAPRHMRIIDEKWNYLELKIRFDEVTSPGGGYAELNVNNTGPLIADDADFFNASGTNTVHFFGHIGTWFIDDIIIMDDKGDKFNDFIGDCRIATMRPNSDIQEQMTQSESGPSYELIDDDLGSTADDTTYLESNTPGLKNIFGVEDLPSNVSEVFGVSIVRQNRITGPSIINPISSVISNSVEQVGTNENYHIAGYTIAKDFFEYADNGSPLENWNKSRVDTMQIAVETS